DGFSADGEIGGRAGNLLRSLDAEVGWIRGVDERDACDAVGDRELIRAGDRDGGRAGARVDVAEKLGSGGIGKVDRRHTAVVAIRVEEFSADVAARFVLARN